MFRDGRLCVGDRIVEIDGSDCTQKTLAQVTLAMSAPMPLMRLTVHREPMEGELHASVYAYRAFSG